MGNGLRPRASHFGAERGLKVDYHSVWDFVHAEKLSFKKSVVAGERDRPDVARRRAQWAKYQDRVEAERLVFIDETRTDGAAAGMGTAGAETDREGSPWPLENHDLPGGPAA